MYSEAILDAKLGFRFPIKDLQIAITEIVNPDQNSCLACKGEGWVLKFGNKSFCHSCNGSGRKGGYGRKYGQVPPAVFEVNRPEFL